ncbi:hypothetical protein Tco_0771962, partial [Tanacetum coccineum]
MIKTGGNWSFQVVFPLVRLVSSLRGFNTSGLHFLNFFNDPRIIRELRIAAYKGYRGGDDEPMWATDRVVASTPGSAITIPEIANEFVIKVLNVAAGGIFLYKTPNQAYQLLEDKVLLKLDWAKNQKTKSSLKKTIAFADEGSSNSDTDKIMARMDAITMKMDARYKEFQSRSKQPNLDHKDDDKPMSLEEEAKFMQTFR